MKKQNVFLMIVLIICLMAVSASAALVDNGNGTITDTDTNLMWLEDANMAGNMNWSNAMTWAGNLVYAGHDNWRLPSALHSDGSDPCGPDYNCTDSEMGHLFYNVLGGTAGQSILVSGNSNVALFSNIQTTTPWYYWNETTYATDLTLAYSFGLVNGYQPAYGKSGNLYSLAVRDIVIIPEPISSTLFLIGGATLGFRRWRKGIK